MIHSGALYGIAVALVGAISLASRDHVIQKLVLVLAFAWAATNLAVQAVGLVGVPLFAPSIELGCFLVTAAVGYANRSLIALAVFVLYGFMIGAHLVAYWTQTTSDYAYFAAINAMFALQLLIVGLSGAIHAALVVRAWALGGGERRSSLLSRR